MPIFRKSNLKKTPLLKSDSKDQYWILYLKCKKNPFVSQVHTPQTKASIRIVLGTLIELTQQVEKLGANKGK